MDNHYIAGFVDGEGSFHVSFQKRQDLRFRWQIFSEFHICQNRASVKVLQTIQDVLQCGYIKENHAKNDKDKTYVYVVRNRQDLLSKIVPFFEKYPLHTAKRNDFEKFKVILNMMQNNDHLSEAGFIEIAKLAFSMNAMGKYRKVSIDKILTSLKSSETTR